MSPTRRGRESGPAYNPNTSTSPCRNAPQSSPASIAASSSKKWILNTQHLMFLNDEGEMGWIPVGTLRDVLFHEQAFHFLATSAASSPFDSVPSPSSIPTLVEGRCDPQRQMQLEVSPMNTRSSASCSSTELAGLRVKQRSRNIKRRRSSALFVNESYARVTSEGKAVYPWDINGQLWFHGQSLQIVDNHDPVFRLFDRAVAIDDVNDPSFLSRTSFMHLATGAFSNLIVKLELRLERFLDSEYYSHSQFPARTVCMRKAKALKALERFIQGISRLSAGADRSSSPTFLNSPTRPCSDPSDNVGSSLPVPVTGSQRNNCELLGLSTTTFGSTDVTDCAKQPTSVLSSLFSPNNVDNSTTGSFAESILPMEGIQYAPSVSAERFYDDRVSAGPQSVSCDLPLKSIKMSPKGATLSIYRMLQDLVCRWNHQTGTVERGYPTKSRETFRDPNTNEQKPKWSILVFDKETYSEVRIGTRTVYPWDRNGLEWFKGQLLHFGNCQNPAFKFFSESSINDDRSVTPATSSDPFVRPIKSRQHLAAGKCHAHRCQESLVQLCRLQLEAAGWKGDRRGKKGRLVAA
ncbi:hypothetical protein BT69DRAFT_1281957 [Atractiella rhizophila]|nr:hypothetical protein BT69DRAFT_1281957 [Atractiella rhizophila]